MKKIGLFMGLAAGLALAGCGEEGVLSSGSGAAPAAKLTVSATKAGGYAGAYKIRLRHAAERRDIHAHDAAAWAANFTEDAVIDYVPAGAIFTGREGAEEFIAGLFHGFPDYRCIEEHMLMAGNIMVTEHTTMGTSMGEWMGMPATGKSGIPHQHLDIWEFEGDKISRLTTYLDAYTLLVNSGLMPPSELPPLEPSFELPAPEPTGLSPLKADAEAVARWNAHDMYHYAQMLDPDGEFFIAVIGSPLNREQIIALYESYFVALPDHHVEVVRRVNLGDGWVLAEAVWTGTYEGPYLDIPATGNSIELRGAWLSHFDADGLMTDSRCYFDKLTVLRQMGVIE